MRIEHPNYQRRYFQIAGITICVESDVDFSAIRFKPAVEAFAACGPTKKTVTLRHQFQLPEISDLDLGTKLYHRVPWSISRRGGTWYYKRLPEEALQGPYYRFAHFSADHTQGTIYSPPAMLERIHVDGWQSLSLFPTDQIWLVPMLADSQAVILHSGAVILNKQGLLFAGHSETGKSTTVVMLKNASAGAEILCDDRNIVRKHPPNARDGMGLGGGWRVHGTWSHGDVAEVSPSSAPLRAILFLEQSPNNRIIRMTDRKEIRVRLLAALIRTVITFELWDKKLSVLESIVDEIPCYRMQFDKTGAIVPLLEAMTKETNIDL